MCRTKRLYRFVQIDPRQIKIDPVGDELTHSEEMKPYLDVFVASMTGQGIKAALQRVAALKLNERYVWRVASALDWAFADSDAETAQLDWQLMSEEDRADVSDMLKFRVVQSAYFIRALYGKPECIRRFKEALGPRSPNHSTPFGLNSDRLGTPSARISHTLAYRCRAQRGCELRRQSPGSCRSLPEIEVFEWVLRRGPPCSRAFRRSGFRDRPGC